MIRSPLIVLAIGAVVVMGSCTADAGTDVSADESREAPSGDATAEPPSTADDYARQGFNTVANRAQAVIVGSVGDLGAMTWNSADGKPWRGNDSLSPISFRDIEVVVSEVLHSSDELSVSTGESLAIRVFGDPPVSPDPHPGVLDGDEWYGRFDREATVLLMLTRSNVFPREGGTTEEMTQTVGGFTGVWTLSDEGGRRFATNVDANWSGPMDAILQKFHAERAAGKRPERDAATMERLLGPEDSATTASGSTTP